MLIPRDQIPQADVLNEVIRTVEAVAGGAETFQDIASILGKVERQGRYYRLAAQIIGLLDNHDNRAYLTEAGSQFIAASTLDRPELLRQAVLNTRLFQRFLLFLEAQPQGATRREVENFLAAVTQTTPAMIERRTSTVIAWASAVGIIQRHEDRYVPQFDMEASGSFIPNIRELQRAPYLETSAQAVMEVQDTTEPLLPRAGDLHEYQAVEARTTSAVEDITVLVNAAARERANDAHRQLVNLVASRIRRAGGIPRSNRFIDLAARINDRPLIFEMKSTTDDNTRSQVRSGLSQLFEYRYLQALPDAVLVLVLERPLEAGTGWLRDYIEKDRNILLLWDGDGDLYASEETQRELDFLLRG